MCKSNCNHVKAQDNSSVQLEYVMSKNSQGEMTPHIEVNTLIAMLQMNADGFKRGTMERATLLVMIDKMNEWNAQASLSGFRRFWKRMGL